MEDKLLKGIRVLDFGSFIAGPAGAMMMAQMGADVIKVENPKRPEGARFFVNTPNAPVADPVYGGQWFDVNNLNKRSITVDFSTPEGKEAVLKLARTADIWIENMPPNTIAKYGLGYQEVRKVKPDIIYLSSCACGQYGPESKTVGYAASFAHKAGLGYLTGYPDEAPSQFVGSIDARSAVYAVVGALSALIFRERTGEGQYIDLASQEVIASQLGDVYLDYIINGHEQARTGNHREGYAPNNAYRCKGEDKWISISIRTDQEWRNLCLAIGRPELADSLCYNTYEKRFARQEELDALLSDWAKEWEDVAAMEYLQKQGVPAGITHTTASFPRCQHMKERGSFSWIDHPKLGKDFVGNPCWRFSRTPARTERHAPVFGEHTEELLEELGYDAAGISALRKKGVI